MIGPALPAGRRARSRQRGAALLTAMMIVTLVATLSAAMIWQQWRSVQVEAAERARAQAQWILLGAVDWARLILREDARAANRGDAVDHLGEPWALPLAEAKLSTFLAADKQNTEDAPDAFLSGQISDAQSRYNLRNLIEPGADFKREQRTLGRLMGFVGARGSAAALAVALRQSAPPTVTSAASAAQAGNAGNAGTGGGAATGPDTSARPTHPSGNPAEGGTVAVPVSADPPLMPERVEQLAWLGVDAETIRRLAPYVTLLPERTPVNLNTAPKEVIAAVVDVDPADAERLVQARQRSPFLRVEQALDLLPPSAKQSLGQGNSRAGVQSKYFEIRGRLRLQDRLVEERALVVRNNLEVIALQRERVTALDSGPP